jgi:vacuolar-type H+-ATPase subunit D/Vma8
LTIILTVKERLTKIETQLQTFTERFDKLEANHLPHIEEKLEKITRKLDALENCQKTKLSGKDKAVVYGSFLTMLGLVLVEIVRLFA